LSICLADRLNSVYKNNKQYKSHGLSHSSTHYVIPERSNQLLAAGLLGLQLCALVLLPLFWLLWPSMKTVLLPLAVAMLVLLALCSTTLWALIHEAIHGLLSASTKRNLFWGRALAIAHGCPLRMLRHGHLHHHRNSRGPADRSEVYDPQQQASWSAALAHYLRIGGGLYVAELLFNLAIFLPRQRLEQMLQGAHPGSENAADLQRASRELFSGNHLRELRVDASLILVLYATALWLWGSLWWCLLLLLAWRALAISMVDNAFHYATPLDDKLYALNLRLPLWVSRSILHFNLHRAHHRDVRAPWSALPQIAELQADDPDFATAVLRQWRGPIALPLLQNLKPRQAVR
jgi:fatty acid desaturase